jgi:hypothetical protein
VIDRLGRAGLIERHSPRVSIREEPGAHSVDEVVLRDVLRHFATAADRAGHWRAPGLGAALRRLLAVLRRRQQRAARDQLADTTEAILGGLRTGAARGTWEEVHQASMALIPAFGAAGLPGAWDAATSRAVEATAELGRPLDQARALQERGCYLAVVHGPKEAAPAFSAALAVADKAVDAPELRSLIARNLEEVAPERGQEAAVEPTPLVDPARPLLQPRRAGPWLEFVLRHRGELLAILSGGAVLAISHRRRGLAVAISITLALYLGFVRHRPRSTDGQAESEANEKTYVDNRVDA